MGQFLAYYYTLKTLLCDIILSQIRIKLFFYLVMKLNLPLKIQKPAQYYYELIPPQVITPIFFVLKTKNFFLLHTNTMECGIIKILVLLFMGNCSFSVRRQEDNVPFIQTCIHSTSNQLQYKGDQENYLNIYSGIISINLQTWGNVSHLKKIHPQSSSSSSSLVYLSIPQKAKVLNKIHSD